MSAIAAETTIVARHLLDEFVARQYGLRIAIKVSLLVEGVSMASIL